RNHQRRKIGGLNRPALGARRRDPANVAVFLHAEVDAFAPLVILIVVIAPRVEQQVAADRSHVSEYRSRDEPSSVCDKRIILIDNRMIAEIRQRNGRADHHSALAIASDFAQLFQASNRYHGLGSLLAALHIWIEVGASGDKHRVGSEVGHHRYGVLHLSWREVFEFRESHHKRIPSILFRSDSRELHHEFWSHGLAFEEIFSHTARYRPAVNPRYASRAGESVRG